MESKLSINDLNKLTIIELDYHRRKSAVFYNELNYFLLKESATGAVNIHDIKELRKFKIDLSTRMEILLDLLEFEKENRYLMQIINKNELTEKFNLFRYNRDRYDIEFSARREDNSKQISSRLHIVK